MTSTYALGVNVGNLGRGDWGADLLEAFKTVGKVRPLGRQSPWLINTAMVYFNPGVIAIFSPQMVNLARNLIFPLEIMRASAEEHARQAERFGGKPPATLALFSWIFWTAISPSQRRHQSVSTLNHLHFWEELRPQHGQ